MMFLLTIRKAVLQKKSLVVSAAALYNIAPLLLILFGPAWQKNVLIAFH
jgi:hypothetical protein